MKHHPVTNAAHNEELQLLECIQSTSLVISAPKKALAPSILNKFFYYSFPYFRRFWR